MYTRLYSASTCNAYNMVISTMLYKQITCFGGFARTASCKTRERKHLQSEVIHSKALVAFGVVDGPRRVTVVTATIDAAIAGKAGTIGSAVAGKAGSFADRNASLGIGASVWEVPEGTAQAVPSEPVGIWFRDL